MIRERHQQRFGTFAYKGYSRPKAPIYKAARTLPACFPINFGAQPKYPFNWIMEPNKKPRIGPRIKRTQRGPILLTKIACQRTKLPKIHFD